MTFQYCSDLHLEFPINKKYLKANPIKPEGEILLLAGDIIPFAEIEKENDFFNFLSDSFEHTYWIPGNHEYYRSDISERTGAFHGRIRSSVSLLNKHPCLNILVTRIGYDGKVMADSNDCARCEEVLRELEKSTISRRSFPVGRRKNAV
ncbi:MAG: metallophosphoesterase [Chryseosolibacter sp.]